MFSTSCEELDSEVEGKDKLIALEDEKREELLDPAIFLQNQILNIHNYTIYYRLSKRLVDEYLLIIPL